MVPRSYQPGMAEPNSPKIYDGPYAAQLIETANAMVAPGKGLLACDESTGTVGTRLEANGMENTEEWRQKWRNLLFTTKGLGDYISGAILFEETLFQSDPDGKPFVDVLNSKGIIPGIKVDTGLKPLFCAAGQPTDLAIEVASQDLARYARICQENGLVPIVEPEILIDGSHDIETTARIQER